jgi:hypothetical protein
MMIGGTTPIVSLWLIEAMGNPTAPAFYLMFGAALSVAAWACFRENARQTFACGKRTTDVQPTNRGALNY